jgi:flavin-dependent dehydrogenase
MPQKTDNERMPLNAAIRKDVQSVVNSWHALCNERATPFYAFSVHVNGKEVAVGAFFHSLNDIGPEWEYVWTRALNRSKAHKPTKQYWAKQARLNPSVVA